MFHFDNNGDDNVNDNRYDDDKDKKLRLSYLCCNGIK